MEYYTLDKNISAFTTDRTIGRNADMLLSQPGCAAMELVYPHQTHTDRIEEITAELLALPVAERRSRLEGIDAVISSVKNVAIAISTADCIPVIVYDPEHHVAAAIHAGWKGTRLRIVEKTMKAMIEKYGTNPALCKAVIGPGISQESFEVGEEVVKAFQQAGFDMVPFTTMMPDMHGAKTVKPHIDLKALNRLQLMNVGVEGTNIEVSEIDTYTDKRFFSARREQLPPAPDGTVKKCGRILSGFILRMLIILFALTGVTDAIAAETIYKATHYDDHNGMSQWHVTKMLQDKHGFIWFSTWNGLNRFDGYEFAVFKSKPGDGNNLTSDRIRNMIVGDDGNIYCVNGNVVWRFNLSTYKFESIDSVLAERYLARINADAAVYRDKHSVTIGDLLFPAVRQVMTDNQKNTWLMEAFGVSKVSPINQQALYLPEVPRSTVRAMYRDRKGRIWIGLRDANTIAVYDSKLNFLGYLGTDGTLHKELTQFYAAYSIYQQKNGTIWIGSKPDGMFRLVEQANGSFIIDHFSPGTKDEIKAGLTINADAVYSFSEDGKGRLWVATQGGGLNIIPNPGAERKLVRFHNCNNTLKSYPDEALFMRRLLMVKGSLILATTTNGLLVIDKINGAPQEVSFRLHQRESTRERSLSCSAVMDMLIDRKGRLFISSESGGVNMLIGNNLRQEKLEFEHFSTDNGMGSDAALAMTEVGDEILIQCNNQLTRLNADLGKIENFNDMFFSLESRFSDAEPILLSDGRWLLSLEDGAMVMSEQAFHQKYYVPRIAITYIDKEDAEADYTADARDTLILEPNQRNILIAFAALDYSPDNSNIKYITRVENESRLWRKGEHTEWSVPSKTRTLTLYDLAPGTYKLSIRSTNAEGMWVENERTVTIIVMPHWWETWWAYLIYMLLFGGVIVLLTKTHIHIKTLEQQRNENLQAYLRLLEETDKAKSEQTDAENNSDNSQQNTEQSETQVIIASPIINEEDDNFMRRLIDFVEQNMGDSDIGVDEIAAATATSRSSLNRKMKALLGVTPAEFLKEARLKRAKQLLATTMRGVNEIAYGCGFSDPKYFSKCFKQSLGMSPSDYRQSVQSS